MGGLRFLRPGWRAPVRSPALSLEALEEDLHPLTELLRCFEARRVPAALEEQESTEGDLLGHGPGVVWRDEYVLPARDHEDGDPDLRKQGSAVRPLHHPRKTGDEDVVRNTRSDLLQPV